MSRTMSIMAATALFCTALPLLAQPGRGRPRTMPRYNPATVATFNGTVEATTEVEHAGYRGKGLHATFKAASGTFEVHFGPIAFLTSQKLTVSKGDQLEIVGSKVNDDGAEWIIAKSVKKGETTTALRDDRGRPLWSGGERKKR